METETRSAPDLSLLREAFLWETMKGESELASADVNRNRATIAEMRALLIGFFAISISDGGGESSRDGQR